MADDREKSPKNKPAVQEKYAEAAKAVQDLHLGRMIRPESDFEQKGTKNAGVSTGYVATDKEQDKTHIVKKGTKDMPAGLSDEKDLIRNIEDRRDTIIEYTASALAERLMPGRAPKIGLVVSNTELQTDDRSKRVITSDDGAKNIGLRSTFFENFQTLSELTAGKHSSHLGSNTQELSKVEGVERVIAGALLMGEIDFHAGNIGAVRQEDGTYKAVKIDHGRSMVDITEDPINISDASSLLSVLANLGYSQDDLKHCFDPEKFVEAVNEMSQISRSEVENMVRKQIYDLRDAGVDFSEVADTYGSSTDPDDIVEVLTDNIMSNVEVMKGIAREITELYKIEAKNDLTPEQKAAQEKGEKMQAAQQLQQRIAFADELNTILPEGIEFKVEDGQIALHADKKVDPRIVDAVKNALIENGFGETYDQDMSPTTQQLDNIKKAIEVVQTSISLQEKWTEHHKGFAAKVKGLNKPFTPDLESDEMSMLTNVAKSSKQIAPDLAVKIDALVDGLKEGRFNKKSFENGVKDLVQDIDKSLEKTYEDPSKKRTADMRLGALKKAVNSVNEMETSKSSSHGASR